MLNWQRRIVNRCKMFARHSCLEVKEADSLILRGSIKFRIFLNASVQLRD